MVYSLLLPSAASRAQVDAFHLHVLGLIRILLLVLNQSINREHVFCIPRLGCVLNSLDFLQYF